MDTPSLIPLIGMTLNGLRRVAEDAVLPKFAAGQMARWLYVARVTDIDAMTDISLAGRARLKERYCVGREEPLMRTVSADGTAKYLFRGARDRDIEAVMIPDADRATLCVSSQAGCRMNCSFCMTGRQGFHGNLTPAQIINQVLSVDESQHLTNIVFMGMGEPTDNLQAVMTAIEVLTEPWGLAWSPKRITVSTVGKLPELKDLLEQTDVHVAISVHSPDARERASMMPAQKAFPIQNVMQTLAAADFSHQRRLSLEYIMWKGVNDDVAHARQLVKLIGNLDARVNLIRFHAIEGVELQPCSEERMIMFRNILNKHGITATIRASRGEDIDAACGQLAAKKN